MKRIIGVSARLLECAKQEFLEKGFQNSSIRDIAKKAGTSSRAVYTRFPNKEGLFDAIVEPISDGLVELYQTYGNTYWNEYKDVTAPPNYTSDPTSIYIDMIDYIYDHRDEFNLLLNTLDGTRHTALIKRLTDMNYLHLEKFGQLQKAEPQNADVMMKVLYMLTNSFYSALFEPLRNQMNLEEARFYVKKLCGFFISGITNII